MVLLSSILFLMKKKLLSRWKKGSVSTEDGGLAHRYFLEVLSPSSIMKDKLKILLLTVFGGTTIVYENLARKVGLNTTTYKEREYNFTLVIAPERRRFK